jgi:hypothetical protein
LPYAHRAGDASASSSDDDDGDEQSRVEDS